MASGNTKTLAVVCITIGIMVVATVVGTRWYMGENGVLGNGKKNSLRDICATAQIPQAELDTTLDEVNRIVTVRWWDEPLQKNVELQLPYEPESGFAGCSASARVILEHVMDSRIDIQ